MTACHSFWSLSASTNYSSILSWQTELPFQFFMSWSLFICVPPFYSHGWYTDFLSPSNMKPWEAWRDPSRLFLTGIFECFLTLHKIWCNCSFFYYHSPITCLWHLDFFRAASFVISLDTLVQWCKQNWCNNSRLSNSCALKNFLLLLFLLLFFLPHLLLLLLLLFLLLYFLIFFLFFYYYFYYYYYYSSFTYFLLHLLPLLLFIFTFSFFFFFFYFFISPFSGSRWPGWCRTGRAPPTTSCPVPGTTGWSAPRSWTAAPGAEAPRASRRPSTRPSRPSCSGRSTLSRESSCPPAHRLRTQSRFSPLNNNTCFECP